MEFSAGDGCAEAEKGRVAGEGVPITLAVRNAAPCKVSGQQDPRFHQPEVERAISDNNFCLNLY